MKNPYKNRLAKVEKFQGIDISLDKESEWYVFKFGGKEYRTRSLAQARGDIQDKQETATSGTYLTTSYDGIRKFSAKFKRGDLLIGMETDRYGHDREERKAKSELFPANKKNLALYEEGRRLINLGWKTIKQGENLADKLTR